MRSLAVELFFVVSWVAAAAAAAAAIMIGAIVGRCNVECHHDCQKSKGLWKLAGCGKALAIVEETICVPSTLFSFGLDIIFRSKPDHRCVLRQLR